MRATMLSSMVKNKFFLFIMAIATNELVVQELFLVTDCLSIGYNNRLSPYNKRRVLAEMD